MVPDPHTPAYIRHCSVFRAHPSHASLATCSLRWGSTHAHMLMPSAGRAPLPPTSDAEMAARARRRWLRPSRPPLRIQSCARSCCAWNPSWPANHLSCERHAGWHAPRRPTGAGLRGSDSGTLATVRAPRAAAIPMYIPSGYPHWGQERPWRRPLVPHGQ